MTINRVAPAGWQYKSSLTAKQLNQLDQNTTYGIDKRDGYSDYINSELTITSGGSLSNSSGSVINIDPAGLNIYPGTLYIGSEINGDKYNNTPLRFGFYALNIAALSSGYVVPAAVFCKSIIRLTGTLTANAYIKFPSRGYQTLANGNTLVVNFAGWYKIIDNATVQDGYSLTVGACDENGNPTGNSIILPPRKVSFIYCDGTNIILGPGRPPYSVSDVRYATPALNPGDLYTSFSSQLPTQTTIDNFNFSNISVGDLLEISYTAGLKNTGSASNWGRLQVFINSNGLSTSLWITNSTSIVYNTFTTTYVAVSSNYTTVSLMGSVDNISTPSAYELYAPYNFSVKLIKR